MSVVWSYCIVLIREWWVMYLERKVASRTQKAMGYKDEYGPDLQNWNSWGRQKPKRLTCSPWAWRWSFSPWPSSPPQLFSECPDFLLFQIRMVMDYFSPYTSRTFLFLCQKLSQKDTGVRSFLCPKIHSLYFWPLGSLVSMHPSEERGKGIHFNAPFIIVPIL